MARHNYSLAHSCEESVGFKEAKKSLEILARSDSGQPWQHAIHNELSLIKRDFRDNSEEIEPNAGGGSNVVPHHRKAA